jgi:hypothetical protein
MKVVIFLLMLFLAQIGCGERWPEERFDPETWKALPWEEHYRLCSSLLRSGALEGASRARVIELLGEPNGAVEPDGISYRVRQREVFGVVGEVKVLDVRFDGKGKVSRAFVRGT